MVTKFADQMTTDVLILGSGLAGLLLALNIADQGASVIVASKSTLGDSNTGRAQGGLAAVLPTACPDSLESHLADTLSAGAGLSDERVGRLILEEAPALVSQLGDLGVEFDASVSGSLDLAREGGHTHPRVLHSKDATGRAISDALVAKVKARSHVLALPNAYASELITDGGGCLGAILLSDGKPMIVSAGQVVLATGGVGQIFERTTNPAIATGDGIALAYSAGARLVDMEFVQFHPTALYKPGCPAFLISEAVRGAGAVLLDAHGERFAQRFHADAELATRDVVARAIVSVMREQETACVWLDLRPIGAAALNMRFPNVLARCRQLGIDPAVEAVPISPAAHYSMGGIWSDSYGRTTLPGLYALGECASTGLHGANRLASNSLLEAGVMALRLARHLASSGKTALRRSLPVDPVGVRRLQVPADLALFRRRMFQVAGLNREEQALERLISEFALSSLPALPEKQSHFEAASMLLVGRLIALAALERRESRGAHYRDDYPAIDDNRYRRRLCLENGQVTWLDVDARGTPVGQTAA